MNSGRSSLIIIAVALSACASHDGSYAPGCLAFAGDRVELRDGRFLWDKFTDEVRVDDSGKVVDRFPGYPMPGSYRVDGSRLSFTADSGTSPDDRYLVRAGGELRMLTPDEYDRWRRDGDYPECSLVRGGAQKVEAARN